MMDKHFEMDDYIMDTCKAWNVDGIIYERMQYCEIWGGELPVTSSSSRNRP